jgi:hypothetical protein
MYGAKEPAGNDNAASIPSPSAGNECKTDRPEKKRDGATTKSPIPFAVNLDVAAARMRPSKLS